SLARVAEGAAMTTSSRKLHEESVGAANKAGTVDQHLIDALREYMRELEDGRVPDPGALQARNPEIGNPLAAGMEGIDIVNALAPSFRELGDHAGNSDDLLPS